FTFIVEKKINNEIQNIFLHDKGNNLKSLSSNTTQTTETTIIAENGIIETNKMILFNGQIISTKDSNKNEIIKFEQLNIDLGNLSAATIKKPKIQETSTLILISCFFVKNEKKKYCNKNFKKEILTTLNRRIIIPFYIPVLSLICSLLLIKSKRFYFNRISVFLYSFTLLLFTELGVRYTGINNFMLIIFMVMPIIFLVFFYTFLLFKFSKESSSV
ncbi:LptF/LptG family permease, partial [Pelagibacteraceae bacterium]|nr:LptF/LptG family permease [Pelagibacteraceae bacterium]